MSCVPTYSRNVECMSFVSLFLFTSRCPSKLHEPACSILCKDWGYTVFQEVLLFVIGACSVLCEDISSRPSHVSKFQSSLSAAVLRQTWVTSRLQTT